MSYYNTEVPISYQIFIYEYFTKRELKALENQPFKHVSTGETIKKIRKNKNYTQKFVTKGILSQSTYSKIEAGRVDPSYMKFSQILSRLDMSEDEFRFLIDEEGDERGEVIQSFFRLNYNDSNALKQIKQRIGGYLENKDDFLLQDIGYICDALILIIEERNYSKASHFATKVWSRLEKFDQWYLTEFRLINSIMFIFPVETILEIAERMNQYLKDYLTRESRLLLNNMQTNICLVLIRNREYEVALEHLNELIVRLREEHNYYLLSIVYMRKGIVLTRLENPDAETYLTKAMRLVQAFDQPELEEAFKNEIEHYTTPEEGD